MGSNAFPVMHLAAALLVALLLSACTRPPADRTDMAPAAETVTPLAAEPVATPTVAAPDADAGRDALRAYLAANSEYTLRDESDFEPLALMRSAESRGPDFHPYVLEGDFNRDGLADLAALVFGPPTREGGFGDSEAYVARVLVFNGHTGGTARLATDDSDSLMPLSAFLYPDEAGAGVWFSVADTDFTGHFVPAGNGYRLDMLEVGD